MDFQKVIDILDKLERIVVSDKRVIKIYERAGKELGKIVAEPYSAKWRVISKKERLALWEDAYSKRGYRTVSLSEFFDTAYGKDISHLLGIKRNPDEKPVLYAGTLIETD